MKELAMAITGLRGQTGYTYHLVKRNGLVALCRMVKPGAKDSFEVIKIQTHKKQRVFKGRVIAEQGDEYYPGAEMWGKNGWSYPDLDGAEAKYSELIKEK